MEREFWRERWALGEIGFHRSATHPYLERFFDRLEVGRGEKVFVPLCGKSLDMLWLRQQGAGVVGVELSVMAVEAFFAENGMAVAGRPEGDFSLYEKEGFSLYCGDLLDFTSDCLSGARAVYDRASLVALPPAMRRRYADHMATLLPSASKVLLIGYGYEQAEMDGPPFSVPYSEVEALFGERFEVELLVEEDALKRHQGLKAKGVTGLSEYACLLERK